MEIENSVIYNECKSLVIVLRQMLKTCSNNDENVAESICNVFNKLISNLPTGGAANEESIKKIIESYINETFAPEMLSGLVTESDVEDYVSTRIETLGNTISSYFYTKSEVDKLFDEAKSNYLTQQQVMDLFAQNVQGEITPEQISLIVNAAIETAGEDVVTNVKLQDAITALNLSSYATKDDLTTMSQNFVSDDDIEATLSGYATTASMADYATKSSLTNYAKTSDLAGYATTESLGNYVTTATLADYVTQEQMAELSDQYATKVETYDHFHAHITDLTNMLNNQQNEILDIKASLKNLVPDPDNQIIVVDSENSIDITSGGQFTVSSTLGGRLNGSGITVLGLLGVKIGGTGIVSVNGKIVYDNTALIGTTIPDLIIDVMNGDVITTSGMKTLTFTPYKSVQEL